MKKFEISMVNVNGESKVVVIEAKTAAKAKERWNQLFGKFWMIGTLKEK